MLHYQSPPEGIAMTLAGLFHHFDAERFRYLAEALRECDRPHLAELADRWASEHADMARRERDALEGEFSA